MKQAGVWALLLAVAASAQAQSQDFTVSAGLKVWNTRWQTFTYRNANDGSRVLSQVEFETEPVLLPLLSLRWGQWLASAAAYQSTDHQAVVNPSDDRREEFDANIGYAVLPNAVLTLGYKRLSQSAGRENYKLAGPVLGLSASAPLGGAVSLYGTFALGRLKPKGTVDLDADYRLLEAGLAYTLGLDRWARSLSFTLGWRNQVLISKNALSPPRDTVTRDAKDLTEGVTLGAVLSF
jgi:hypothetical protein